MSTNARIGIENGDGTATSIYTHWDGYPTHHAPILQEHYATDQHLRQLLALGDLSILDAAIGEKHDFDMGFEDRAKLGPWCVAYGRDRGEDDVAAKTHPIDQWPDYGQEYEYLLKPGGWVGRAIKWKRTGTDSLSRDTFERVTSHWIPLADLLATEIRETIAYLKGELEHADRAGSARQEIERLQALL